MADAAPLCGHCKQPTSVKCSGCSNSYFCGTACQQKAWPIHVFECNPKKQPNTAYQLALAVRLDIVPTHIQTYKDYGFARCMSEDQDLWLLGLYKGLLTTLAIDPMVFYRARRQGTLLEEVKKHYEKETVAFQEQHHYPWPMRTQYVLDVKQKPQSHMAFIIEDGVMENDLSVEYLARWAKNPLTERPKVFQVEFEYGFGNCKNHAEVARLLSLYTLYFLHPRADPYQLHAACHKSKIFEHVSSVIFMTPHEKQFAKTHMTNMYGWINKKTTKKVDKKDKEKKEKEKKAT